MLDLSEFRDVFLEELDDQLQTMEREILALEKNGGDEAGIQRMFRAAHTLKGSSAAMGFERMKLLTHEMEHMLDQIRNREASVSSTLINVFFACLDRMKRLQREIVEHNWEKSEIADLLIKLQALHTETRSAKREEAIRGIPADVLASLPQEWSESQQLILIRVWLSEAAVMRFARLNLLDIEVLKLGTVCWRDPDLQADLEDEQILYAQWVLHTQVEQDEISRTIGPLMDVDRVELEAVRREQRPAEGAAAEPVENYKSNTIRVNVDRLEQLMNYVGELVIEQTRIHQVEKQFRQRFGANPSIDELGDISDHLTRIVGELQESVMKVRMLPIDQLFSRFPRMIRDLSQSLHKDVELILEGRDTELDRTLIEEIGDPLIHLIRNAIDHGIETPEVRRSFGKPEKGALRIQAAHEDNQIAITVADDGAGIDPGKIRKAAIAKGILSEEQSKQISDSEAIHLIFHPGFSTAARLSDVSGRGVGMDIVRTDIERLNGLIEIDTKLGAGTTFKIKLPLTLAIITGLLVTISARTFILPMSNVAEIVRVETKDIKKVRGIPVIALRDQIVPCVWLNDYFNLPRQNQNRKFFQIVIIGRAEKRIAVVVDELKGNQEIVIKSLGSFIGKLDGIAGATTLGDGRVALILEVGGIMKLVNHTTMR